MNETIAEKVKTDKRVVYVERIDGHPLNRHFDEFGPTWDSLYESVKTHGVMDLPLLRYMEDGRYQAISGHRRLAVARALGIEKLDCIVRKMTDREALELLVIANLEKEDVDPVEEGKLLRAFLAEEGVEIEALAFRLKRSVEWIRVRQGLLELGDVVCAAVRLPATDERHLNLGAVEVLLKVAAEDREEAVQMVLFPESKLGPLNQREAEDVIRQVILEPRRKELEWKRDAPALVKAWRKQLAVYLTKDEKLDLIVQAVSWGKQDEVKQAKRAEALLADEAGVNLEVVDGTRRWLHLALLHMLPVWIIPADNAAQSEAYVDGKMLLLAEAAKVEHGMVAWLGMPAKKGVGTSNIERPTSNVEGGEEPPGRGALETDEEWQARVDNALHVLDGGGEKSYRDHEEVETVIEQRMEHWAMIDIGKVKHLANADDITAAMPTWAQILDSAGYIHLIPEICDWVLSLKQGAGN